jgi:hypothetical protein
MVTNSFRTIIFVRPMRRLDMCLGRPNFFLCWVCEKGQGEGEEGLLSPMCSQCVHQEFPNNTTLLSYMFCPMLNFHIPIQIIIGGAKGSTYVLLFSKNIFSSAQYFPKKWDWAIKVAFTNKQTNKQTKNPKK